MKRAVSHLEKSFDGKRVLRDFSAEFADGSVICIMGPSGCGKTTLLRIIMGLEKPDAGTVEGFDKGSFTAVFQEERLCEGLSAVGNVALVVPRGIRREQVEEHLAEVGLAESLHQPVRELSGGMRRRVTIVRAMLTDRKTVLMDEPFKGLDEQTREQVVGYIRRQIAGKTLLVVTHDPDEVPLLGGSLLTMKKED